MTSTDRSDITPRPVAYSDRVAWEFTTEQVYALAHQAAGVGSGAVMRLAPDVVMPSEDIHETLVELLEEIMAVSAPEGYR